MQDSNKGLSKAEIKAKNAAANQANAQKRKADAARNKEKKIQSDPFFSNPLDNGPSTTALTDNDIQLDHGTSSETRSRRFKNSSDAKSSMGNATKNLREKGMPNYARGGASQATAYHNYDSNMMSPSDTVSAAPDVKTKIGGIGEESKKAAAAATAEEGFFSGISGAFKKDGQTIRNSLGRMSDALNQEDTIAKMTKEGANEAAIKAFKADNKFSKIGGDFLDEFGGGSKAMGGAKLGAYVVGGSMLVDFLNPFDDD